MCVLYDNCVRILLLLCELLFAHCVASVRVVCDYGVVIV